MGSNLQPELLLSWGYDNRLHFNQIYLVSKCKAESLSQRYWLTTNTLPNLIVSRYFYYFPTAILLQFLECLSNCL